MDWSFDLRTAVLFGALVTLLTAAFLLLGWRSLRGSVRPSFRWWLASLLLFPLGMVLGCLHDPLAGPLAAVVGDSVLAFAMSSMAVAMRAFYGMPERRPILFALTALVGLAMAAIAFGGHGLHWPLVVRDLLFAVLLACGARAIFRRNGPSGRVPRLTGALFALAAGLMLVRAGHGLLWPVALSGATQGPIDALFCLGVMVLLPLLATVGFLLMCTERGQEELERTARLDFLTGIFNRRAIEDLASRAISAARRRDLPLAIMILDLDHFKRINDGNGHEVGDQALLETVRRMRAALRAEDLVGRLGGEEFVAVMPDIDLASAHAAAERLRRTFAEAPMLLNNGSEPIEVTVTVSIGVAALEPGDLLFSHLLRRADQAMYAAKEGGRNLVMLDAGRP